MADNKSKKTTAAKATASLPAANALKARFKAGSIPLQSDFSDLIDMANSGFRATGQAADQNGPGKGMRISATGQLEPDVDAVNYKNDNNGCSQIKINSDNNKLVIDIHDGLANFVNTGGVELGLGVKAGNGIKVDTNGVSIDPDTVLPKGIITMFSGAAAPEGWAICDGNNGTPNLIDRFILGGNFTDAGGVSKNKAEGSKENKTYSISTELGGNYKGRSVTVESHILTVLEMPEHRHVGSVRFDANGPFHDKDIKTSKNEWAMEVNSSSPESIVYSGYTQYQGSGLGHKHNASVDLPDHTHQINAITPYYILAFIMKL